MSAFHVLRFNERQCKAEKKPQNKDEEEGRTMRKKKKADESVFAGDS